MSSAPVSGSNANRWPTARTVPVVGSTSVGWAATTRGPQSVAELTRKGYIRLAERLDPARTRHKPLSLLRQEGKRHLEQLLEADGGHLSKADRERVTEDAMCGTLGLCPLEELFRDETRQEILALAWNQVIARTGEQWLPTSARFRDADQYRDFVLRLAEVGKAVGSGAEPGGAFDVTLPNGFRAVAILPPGVMGQPPLLLLARGDVPPVPPPSTRSGLTTTPAPRAVPVQPPPPITDSVFQLIPANPITDSGTRSSPAKDGSDLYARLRSRVTERLIARCAAAGVYDMTQIATAELRRILTVHVAEVATAERLRLDESDQEKIALQILVAMNR